MVTGQVLGHLPAVGLLLAMMVATAGIMSPFAHISVTWEGKLRLLYRLPDILLSAGECV